MIVLGWNLRVFTERGGEGVFGPRTVWRESWVGASPGSYEGVGRGMGMRIGQEGNEIVGPYVSFEGAKGGTEMGEGEVVDPVVVG